MRDWRHRAGRSRRLRVGSALIGSALLIIGLIATSPGAAAARRPESAGASARKHARQTGHLVAMRYEHTTEYRLRSEDPDA